MKKLFLILGSCSLLLIGIGLYVNGQQTPYSEQFIQIVETNYREKLDSELLDFYQDKIVSETKSSNSRRELRKSYYALALLEHAKGNYTDSIHYLHKILAMSDTIDPTLNVLVQEGLAINYLALQEMTDSYSHFKKAEQLTKTLGDQELMGRLYNRYGHAVLIYSNRVGVAINLFEHCLTFDIDSNVKLDATIFLAESYLAAGLYDRAINYLIRSFELSIINGSEERQPSILTDLAIAYFLNHNYQSSLNAIEQLYQLEMENSYFPYSLFFVKIAKQAYGEQESEAYLANYSENLGLSDEMPTITSDMSYIYQIEWLLHQDNRAEALTLMGQLDEKILNEYEEILKQLFFWSESMNLWQQYETQQSTSEELIEQYNRLYEQVLSLEHSKIKIVLLDKIVSEGVAVGNYELGYKYLTYQNNLISGGRVDFEPDTIQTITEQIIEEAKRTEQIQRQTDRFYVFSITTIMIGVFGLGYIILQKYLKLKRETKQQLMMQSLTQTLTKEALYQELEVHAEYHHQMTFIAIDIDDFNRYNELYGYLQGDIVLKQLANTIKEVFPQGYINRHHQCFIVVIEGPDYDCTDDLKRLFDSVTNQNIEYATNLEHKRITISAGVSQGMLKSTNDIDTYINRATYKLKLSKKRGKNTFTL